MKAKYAQGQGTTHLYPANTRVVGHGSEVKKGMVLMVGRREKSIRGFPLKLFWGKCPTGMIPPKREKDELESLGA